MSTAPAKRRVSVVTGSRAEFGLLEPVMRAVDAHPALELSVIVAGAHFLPPAETWREVEARWGPCIGAEVPMQQSGHLGRFHDSHALGHGVSGMAGALEQTRPDWVVVLGDRIEPLAAAAAAAVAGVGVAHLHGGDRAEGVADESIRHAISKLAHLHLPATPASAQRLVRMGERPETVHVVGSPAIDTLTDAPDLPQAQWEALGRPSVMLLLHPIGDPAEIEDARAVALCDSLRGERVLWMEPNHDPGREGIMRACAGAASSNAWARAPHLPRDTFVALLRRLADSGGVVVGNSSAGLIECAALRTPVVDIGERQAGRERAGNVVHVDDPVTGDVADAIARARRIDRAAISHPYGDGRAGVRIAELLASIDPHDRALIRKRCTY